jgi:hypothetical protein
MPGYNSPSRGTARTLPNFLYCSQILCCAQILCCSMYCLFCVVLYCLCVNVSIVQLPPRGNPLAVNKYIISNQELSKIWSKVYIGLHVKYLLFLSDFNKTWSFSKSFRKILKYETPWKSVHWEPICSLRTDGWTDRRTDGHDETDSLFRYIANAPKNET